MRRESTAAALLIAPMIFPLPLHAADSTGETLHAAHCVSCHGSEVYERGEQRRVTSREGLTRQVRRCELALGLTWFDEQIDAVADYLNQSYYHFGQ